MTAYVIVVTCESGPGEMPGPPVPTIALRPRARLNAQPLAPPALRSR